MSGEMRVIEKSRSALWFWIHCFIKTETFIIFAEGDGHKGADELREGPQQSYQGGRCDLRGGVRDDDRRRGQEPAAGDPRRRHRLRPHHQEAAPQGGPRRGGGAADRRRRRRRPRAVPLLPREPEPVPLLRRRRRGVRVPRAVPAAARLPAVPPGGCHHAHGGAPRVRGRPQRLLGHVMPAAGVVSCDLGLGVGEGRVCMPLPPPSSYLQCSVHIRTYVGSASICDSVSTCIYSMV
jgi:hypothetical protein